MTAAHLHQLALLGGELLVAAGILLLLFRLRTRFGLVPLFVTLGSFQYVQVALSTTLYVEIFAGIWVSPGSVVLFAGSLFAVLLLYVRGNIEATRTLIYALVFANIALAAMTLLATPHLGLAGNNNIHNVPAAFFTQNPRVWLVGTAALYLDAVLVVLLYEWLRGLFPNTMLLPLLGALIGTLAFDTVVFATGAFVEQPIFRSVLISGLVGKSLAGFCYGLLLYAYLKVFPAEDDTRILTIPIADLFNSLTLAKKLEQVQASEERYALAIAGANDGLWDWDLVSDRIYFSRRWFGMSGIDADGGQHPSRLWFERVVAEDLPKLRAAIDDHLQGKTPHLEHRYRMDIGGGRHVWMLGRGTAVRDSAGDALRFAGSQSDISAQVAAELARENLITLVSHELRTPITAISGGLKLLRRADKIDAQERKLLLEVAERNSERLSLLIDDILWIQKLESGHMQFDMQRTDLRQVVLDSVTDNVDYASRLDVTFEVRSPDEKQWVVGDSNRLHQVMSNLLSNAAKFSPQGEKVLVRVHHDGLDLRVAVADQGPGIGEEFRSELFKKFTQERRSGARKPKGTGLGLAICKHIVEHHGGRIGVNSAENKGAEFWFVLPPAPSGALKVDHVGALDPGARLALE